MSVKIAFIVGKTADVYKYKITSKYAPAWLKAMAKDERFVDHVNESDDREDNNTIPSDVAMAMNIAYNHPDAEVSLLDCSDFTNVKQSDLDVYDVIFVIYDAIEVFHSGACGQKTCPILSHKMERMLAKTSAFVYPHPDFHKYIISKPDYYTDLQRAGLPVAPFFKAIPENVINDINAFRRKVEHNDFKGIIVKPSYAGYSLGIKVMKNFDRTSDSTIESYFTKLQERGFPSAVVQEFVPSFGSNYEIRTYWIDEKYAFSVATLTEAVGHGDGLPITAFDYFESEGGNIPDTILAKLKPIAKKAIGAILQYPIKHPMIRVDFGCCLKRDGCEESYFINEIETYAANQLANHTEYPVVENVAEASYRFAKQVKGKKHYKGRRSTKRYSSQSACRTLKKHRKSKRSK
jgi:hypothetical protein